MKDLEIWSRGFKRKVGKAQREIGGKKERLALKERWESSV
jgi:hypothetical protein